MAESPLDTVQNPMKRLPRRVEAVTANLVSFRIMAMVLQWIIQQAHIGVMVSCSQTSRHISVI